LAWLSTSWRHARLMMSKQAWRVVLEKNTTGGEKTQRREEKVRDTAQESLAVEAHKTTT